MAEPRLTRRDFLRLGLLPAAGPLLSVLSACARKAPRRAVSFLNWTAYIAPDTLPAFSKETGIAVDYDVFTTEAEIDAAISAIRSSVARLRTISPTAVS